MYCSRKPDDTERLLMIFIACTASGWRARNVSIFFRIGFMRLAGRAGRQPNCRKTLAGVFTGNIGRLIIAVRHSSPSGSQNRSPRPRTISGAIGNIGVAAAKREAADDGHSPVLKTTAFDRRVP